VALARLAEELKGAGRKETLERMRGLLGNRGSGESRRPSASS
jgi:hypothetical protein